MAAMRSRREAYNSQFWTEGEPWDYLADRKDLTYELVNYVKLETNRRTWSDGMPTPTSDAINAAIRAIQPQGKDARVTGELDECAGEFKAIVAGIMVRHFNRKIDDCRAKCRGFNSDIRPRCQALAVEKVTRTFGNRMPMDLEDILRQAFSAPSTDLQHPVAAAQDCSARAQEQGGHDDETGSSMEDS